MALADTAGMNSSVDPIHSPTSALPASRLTRRIVIGVALGAAFLAVVALVMSALTIDRMDRRVLALERQIAERDRSDPLMPPECRWTLPDRPHDTQGDTPDHPCQVRFERLLQAPQQFNGRWVSVDGIYDSSFERTALRSPRAFRRRVTDDQRELYDRALWVRLQLCPETKALQAPDSGDLYDIGVRVVGRFASGASGHMGQYAGEIQQAVQTACTGDEAR